MSDNPTAILLLNLGTPDSPAVSDVRRYLREFLSDPTESHCLASADCCDAIGPANQYCYRATPTSSRTCSGTSAITSTATPSRRSSTAGTEAERKVPKRLPDYLRPDEVPPLLASVTPKWRALFATAIYTGLRKGELFAPRKSDVEESRRLPCPSA